MKPAALFFKTFLLAVFTLSLLSGAIVGDYYLRHEVTRKAKRFLTDRGIEPTVDSAINAAEKGELILLEKLELAGISLGLTDDKGNTPLLKAVKSKNQGAINFLMERQGVIDSINSATIPGRETPLSAALLERDFELADRLIERGASLKVDKEAGLPIIIDAVVQGDQEMLDYLIAKNADVDYKGAQPTTALAYASDSQSLEKMRLLLKSGASPDVRGISGKPLIIEAAKEGNMQKVRMYLSHDVDINALTGEGVGMEMSALSFAIENGDNKLRDLLLEKGADTNVFATTGVPLLHYAVRNGDYELSETLLAHKADPNIESPDGEVVLVSAVENEDLDLLDLLIDHDADPSMANQNEVTPLDVAVGNGNVAATYQLITAGAELDEQALLAKAYELRDDPLMNLILNSGGDPESTIPGTDERLFDIAVRDGATGAVRTLLAAGAGIGDNLWAALLTEQDDLIRLILEAGANPRQRGPEGQDPLEYCLSLGRYKAARDLLAGGANPNAMANDSETWLAKSIREGNSEMALALVESGAKVEGMKTKDGHTFLGWACAHQMVDVVVALLKAGADPDESERSPARSEFREMFDSNTFRYHLQVDRGIRPIMMAAAHRNAELAQALMDGGANGRAYSRKYLMAASIGAWYKDTKIQQIALLGKVPEMQPRKIVVDLSSQRVTLYENGVATYSTRCSTGKSGYRTPAGEYVISDRHRHHNSSIYGSSMPYFQRFSFSAFGIHQGYVPNYPASHGCIRLPWDAAKYLFGKLEVGDYALIQQ